jgi:hypothetical protein
MPKPPINYAEQLNQPETAPELSDDGLSALANLFGPNVPGVFGGIQVVPDGKDVIIGGLRLSMVGLQIQGDLNETQWYSLFEGISKVKRAYQWMRGDWLVYGLDRQYGKVEEQYNALSLKMGLSIKTLENIYTICSKIEISRRRENLTFAHHAEVVALDADEQDYWLAKAEAQEWSAKTLRRALQGKPLVITSPTPFINKTHRKGINKVANRMERGKATAADIQWMRDLLDSVESALLAKKAQKK